MGILLLMIAIIPPLILMGVVYAVDGKEHEPIGLVIGIFGLGMLSVIPVLIMELIGETIENVCVPIIGDGALYEFISCFFVIAVTEEFFKFAIVRIFIWYNKNFNYRFDAIVYCVAASLGFALVENICYVVTSGFGTGIVRAILSIPGHCSFAIFMGFLLGNARCLQEKKKYFASFVLQVLAYVVPVCIHGFYDFCLSLQSFLVILIFVLFILVIDILSIVQLILGEAQDVPFKPIELKISSENAGL